MSPPAWVYSYDAYLCVHDRRLWAKQRDGKDQPRRGGGSEQHTRTHKHTHTHTHTHTRARACARMRATKRDHGRERQLLVHTIACAGVRCARVLRVYYACACTRVCTITIKVSGVSCARHPCDALEHACAVPRRARAATYTALCTVRGASWSPAAPPPDAVFLPSANAVKAAATASTTCQGAGWWQVGSRANIPKQGVHNTCASSSDQHAQVLPVLVQLSASHEPHAPCRPWLARVLNQTHVNVQTLMLDVAHDPTCMAAVHRASSKAV